MKKSSAEMATMSLSDLISNEANPRTSMDDAALNDLASSISQHGLIEPLVVRKDAEGTGKFVIIAGHRRAAAASIAGLKTVPCVVRDSTQDQDLVLALVENMQWVDLTPCEIAASVKIAMKSMTQKQIAATIGKSPAYVSKFATISKAIDKLERDGGEGQSGYLADYDNYETLYQEALRILGKIKTEGDAEKGQTAVEEEGEEGDDTLDSLIRGHAHIAKVGLKGLATGKNEAGHLFVDLQFKNEKEAEKFFSAYGVKS